jgi:hypothetical protein
VHGGIARHSASGHSFQLSSGPSCWRRTLKVSAPRRDHTESNCLSYAVATPEPPGHRVAVFPTGFPYVCFGSNSAVEWNGFQSDQPLFVSPIRVRTSNGRSLATIVPTKPTISFVGSGLKYRSTGLLAFNLGHSAPNYPRVGFVYFGTAASFECSAPPLVIPGIVFRIADS